MWRLLLDRQVIEINLNSSCLDRMLTSFDIRVCIWPLGAVLLTSCSSFDVGIESYGTTLFGALPIMARSSPFIVRIVILMQRNIHQTTIDKIKDKRFGSVDSRMNTGSEPYY